jgi:hypothetical protein
MTTKRRTRRAKTVLLRLAGEVLGHSLGWARIAWRSAPAHKGEAEGDANPRRTDHVAVLVPIDSCENLIPATAAPTQSVARHFR